MANLFHKLNDVLNYAKAVGPDDVDLAKMVLGAMEDSGISTMTLVLHLAELQKKKAESVERDYRIALDAACNALTSMAQKTLKEGKGTPEAFVSGTLMNNDSIAHVAYFLKMWVPNPEKGGFSNLSTWMLDKALEVFELQHYLPGGSSHDWAQQYGLYEYIARLAAIKSSRAG